MFHLHMAPAMSHIRVYGEPNGYDLRLPYLAILTVMHKSPTHVYLMGASGTVNREMWIKAFELLQSMGVTTVELERRGKMRTMNLNKPSI